MDSRLYRQLHESAGDDKDLEKVMLREDAAEQLRHLLTDAPGWSNIGQNDSRSTGTQPTSSQ
jgi:hypothetical protein